MAKKSVKEKQEDVFDEGDYDYSEKPKSKEKNIFGKSYAFLESKYLSFSDWLSKKGIPLNKVNGFLDEKGIPAFAFVSCFFILLVAVLVLLIVNLATTAKIPLSISDYSGNKLSDVQLIITDLNDKTKFSDIVTDGVTIKAKLKSGSDYKIQATKSGLEDYSEQITFERGNQINIRFNEKITTGDLSITVVDTQTKKRIPLYEAKLTYRVNGATQEDTAIASESGGIMFTSIPLNKDLTLAINADGYQSYSQTFRQTNYFEAKNIELEFDESSILLSGTDAKVTIVVTNENDELLDQADITIYDMAGDIIATDTTKLGKAIFTLSLGQPIRFVIEKEGYKIFDSNKESRTYRIQSPEEIYTAKLVAGSTDLRVVVFEKADGPLTDVSVQLYSENGNKLHEVMTLLDGTVIFTGLDRNTNYIVTACKDSYYCQQSLANVEEINEIEFYLEKATIDTSAILSIYVYDTLNNPIPTAKLKLFKEFLGKFVPSGHGVLSVDLTGEATITAKQGEVYRVTAIAGDSEKTSEITIDPLKDNKLILVLDNMSRLVKLKLTDKEGNAITDGCVLIKSKTGEILFDDCFYGSDSVEFNTQGYKDIIVEYTDAEGNLTSMATRVGEADEINLKVAPSVVGESPVISYVELRDTYNSQVPLLSVDEDYYAVFDVLFPEGATNCGVHFRAGDDMQSDSENMSYGIAGYKADSTSYKYSTTYNPGQQAVDYDNTGVPNQLNKWLEIYWHGESQLSNKQVMVKLKAIDSSEKFILKYRAWCEADGKVHRDPVDLVINDARSSPQRQFLYAETREKTFDILEERASCSDSFCIDYKFVDSYAFEYTPENFFAVADSIYALEFNLLSVNNTEISIDTETEKARPIVGLVNYQDTGMFPGATVASDETQLSYTNLYLESSKKKQVYLFFVTNGTGVTYLDIKITNNSKVTEKRISFNVVPKRAMDISVDDVIRYNSPIIVEVKDRVTKKAIENAFVKVSDEFGGVLGSVKNSKSGRYIINQNFTASKPRLDVTAPGYIPYQKELTIADTGLLYGPDKLEIRFGEGISQEIMSFVIVNKSNQEMTDLVYEMRYIDYVNGMIASVDMPGTLKPGASQTLELVTTINPEVDFKTAKGTLIIYGYIGNRQVVKQIEVIYYRGTVKNDCLDIKPTQLFAYVGISEGSTQELSLSLKNNCDKPLSLIPQLLNVKGTAIRKDENIEIILPTLDLMPGDEVSDYTITVKNNKERKLTKSYSFEIAWRNQYYVFDNTKLTVELVDLSKSLVVTPASSVISLIQTHSEQPALNQTSFLLTNTGKHPVTDIQISRYEPRNYSNIEDKIEPMTFEVINPGETKHFVIRYSGKIDKATYADLLYKITANAKGVSTPITTQFVVGFAFSSAGCLKLDQSRISFYTRINEEKTKSINITNQCAEPVGLISHDQGNAAYFADTFGDGTAVTIFPAVPTSIIYQGQTVSYYIKIKPTKYFPAKTDRPIRFLGLPTNSGQGGVVSSDVIMFSLEVAPETPEQKEDFKRVEENIRLPVCGEDEESNGSEISVNYPVVAPDCKQDGYCDAESAAEFILEKIQDMYTDVVNSANQADNLVFRTACSQVAANNGYCPIEDILSPQKMLEYKNVLLYLQNDALTERTIELAKGLKGNESRFSAIKNYMVRPNVGTTTGGLVISGNIIHIPTNIKGCGRYKLEFSGYIATKNYTTLDPQRMYFFVSVMDYNKTEQCNKVVENVMVYLPKDLQFTRTTTGGTWLTIISGQKDFAEPIAKDVFGSEDRFVLANAEQKKYSVLDVTIDELKGGESTAIAKLYFKNPAPTTSASPEEIGIIINNQFGITKAGTKGVVTYPEEFKKETAKNIKAILEGRPANVCISKDRSYLLIRSIDKDFGTLLLKSKTDGKLGLLPTKTCTQFTVKSPVDEMVTLYYEAIPGVQVVFNYEEKDYPDRMQLVLEKDKEKDFNVCIKSDLSQISSWNEKELKIIAESKFSEVGKINAKRKGEASVKLGDYGVTPVELLSIIQRTTEELGADKNSEVIYAFVDWGKEYNSASTEEYCKALEKYNKGIGNAASAFRTPTECHFEETSAEKSAKSKRAVSKSATYFGACFASCAAAQGIADFAWQFIPGVGQVKYGKDLIWNCGFGCGIPTVSIFLRESEIIDSVAIEEKIVKVVGRDVYNIISWPIRTIFGLDKQAEASDAVVLAGGAVGVTGNILKTKNYDVYPAVGDVIAPELQATSEIVASPPGEGVSVVKEVVEGAGSVEFSNNLKTNLSNQMKNRLEYIDRALPVKGTSTAPGKFLKTTGNYGSSITINRNNLSPNELKQLTDIAKKTTENGQFSWQKFNQLYDAELDDFTRLLQKAGYSGQGASTVSDVGTHGLSEKLNAFKSYRASGSGTQGISEIAEDIAKAGGASAGSGQAVMATATITQESLESSLASAEIAKKELAKYREDIVKDMDSLGKKSQKSFNKKKASILDDRLEKVDDIIKQNEDNLDILKNIKNTQTPQSGVYTLSDDVARKLNTNIDTAVKSLSGGVSKATKIGRTIGKGILDIGVIYVSNLAANEVLNNLAEKGKLAGEIYIEGLPISEFRKQTWYRVQVYKSQNRSFTQVYTIEEPNITTENIIFYKTNNELKKLITTEHTEEMYQTSNPQQTELYIPKASTKDQLSEESIVTLVGLQTYMYNQKIDDLQKYTNCSFSSTPTSCYDLETVGTRTKLKSSNCSAFVQRLATLHYGLNYTPGSACTSSTENFGTINNVVWQYGVDHPGDFENSLVPGVAITMKTPGNSVLNCEPSHVVLYIGKLNGTTHYIIHQWGSKVLIEPLYKSEGGRFTYTDNIYQVVIPRDGYALYSEYSSKIA